jgi:hypothetical protein
VNPKNINQTNIYIRPSDNAILLKGDFYGECGLKEHFNWYNDKIYFWKIAKESLSLTTFNIVLYFSFRQIVEQIRDFFSKHH